MAGVVLDRLLRQAHPDADLPVGQTFPDQPQHGAFLVGEQADPVAPGRPRAAGPRRAVEHRLEQRAARGDGAHGRHQRRPAHLLEQEAGGSGPHGGLHRLLLREAGQHQAAQVGHPVAQRPAELRAVAVGQPHVHHHHVRTDGRHAGQCLRDAAGLAGHGDPGIVLEHLGDAAADHLVVVDEEDPDVGCRIDLHAAPSPVRGPVAGA
jgi:hypothetical protein